MEIAFVSANKMHIELEKKREGFIPKILSIITHKSSKFITTMLVGNNISLVIYSYYMGKFLIRIYTRSDTFNEFSGFYLIQTYHFYNSYFNNCRISYQKPYLEFTQTKF